MKKLTKILLVSGLVCTVVGASFGIVSLCAGFHADEFHTAITDGRFQIAGGSRQVKDAVELVSGTAGGQDDFAQTYSGIKSLELDIDAAKCTILPSDTGKWRVIGRHLPSRFKCRQKGDTLEVDCRKNGFWNFFNFSGENSRAELEIWIPEEQLLEEFTVDFGVGDFNAVKSVLKCKEMTVDCGVGDCMILADITKNIKIDCGVGSVDLTLVGNEQDFNYEVDCGIGEVQIGGAHYSRLGSKERVNNKAKKAMNIACGVGSVTVDFEERQEKK